MYGKEGAAHRAAPPRRPFPLGPTIAGVVLLAAGGALLWSAAVPASEAEADTSLRGPWVFPLSVATAWIALSALYLVLNLVSWLRAPSAATDPAPAGDAADPAPAGDAAAAADDAPAVDADDDGGVRWIALTLLVAAIAGFALLMKPLGFVVAGSVFMLASTKIFGSSWPRNLLRDAVVAALVPFVVLLIVQEALGIRLAEGVLHVDLQEGEFYFLPPIWELPW